MNDITYLLRKMYYSILEQSFAYTILGKRFDRAKRILTIYFLLQMGTPMRTII